MFSPGVLYGTRGTPIGIIVATRLLPLVFVIVCCKTFSAKVFARQHAEPIDRAYTEFILFKPEYELIRYEEDGDEEEERACAPKEEVEHAETKDPLGDEEDDEDAFDVLLAEEEEEGEMVLLEAVKTLALLSADVIPSLSVFACVWFLLRVLSRKTRLEDEDKSNRTGRKEREKKKKLGIRVGHPKLGERRKKRGFFFLKFQIHTRARAHKRERDILVFV